MRFRIATFNMYQGFAQWAERRALIVEQLAGVRPDILCVNEVGIPDDTGHWLWHEARALGMDYAYLQQTKTGALSAEEGQAIFTRFPVIESGFLDYRSSDRIAQVARLRVEDSLVDVYLTHLHHVREEESLRVFQAEQLLAWIEARDAPAARLVCGDFNAQPDSVPIQRMAASFAKTQSEPTFPTPLRYAPYAEHHGEPEELFVVCLDYIWYQPALRLVDEGRCFDLGSATDPYLWPSDHIGLWADFELAEPGVAV